MADRPYAGVAWCLIAGALWLLIARPNEQGWTGQILLGLYLLALLAAICAIDARFGIIPDSLVLALVAGGAIDSVLVGQDAVLERGLAAVMVMILGSGLRRVYRAVRGYDGLGFGDVKLLAAGALWIGMEGIPGSLLIAVASACVSLLVLAALGSRLDGKQAISFGPHLAVGIWLSWVIGPITLNV